MGEIDSVWEKIHSSREWGQYPTEQVIRFVARNYYNVIDKKSIKILDYGCGGGNHTWYLCREGFDVYAFDGSKSAINRVEKRLRNERLYADLRVLKATEIDYESDFFDAVIDNVCIYANLSDDIINMYHQIYRVLKRGGKLYTSVFSVNTTGFATGKQLEYHTYCDIPEGNLKGMGKVHFFDEEEIYSMLSLVGFINIRIGILKYEDEEKNVVEQYCVKAEKNE